MKSAEKLLTRIVLSVIGGLPLLALSGLLLTTWMTPGDEDGFAWLRAASMLIVFEFVLLHSGAFMATGPVLFTGKWQRLAWFLAFCLVYAGSSFAFAHWSGGHMVFWTVFAVLVSRLMTLVVLDDRRGIIMMFQRSAVGMIILIVTAVICFLPLPQLGITEEIRSAAFGSADDMLREHPERTLAWGVVYFFLMALVEFYVGWRLPDWTQPNFPYSESSVFSRTLQPSARSTCSSASRFSTR